MGTVKRVTETTIPGFRRWLGVPGWVILAFWVFFGLVAGHQIILSMPTHGHSWWKMVGWQVGAAMGWAALTPVVLWLGMRYPLLPRIEVVFVHLVGALVVAAIQVVPTTLLAMSIDPYKPVVEAMPFVDEYLFQHDNWLLLDVLLYFGLVAVGTGIESKRRLVREAQLRAELAQAELRALRLELHPHFLFNALNAVAGLIQTGAVDEAERMLMGLSQLLRSTLDSTGRQLVTVAEEIHLVKLYLDIQKVRFGDRLGVALEVDAEAGQLLVPNLLLQPIVENAVRHGVGRRAEGGTITVRATRKGDRLVLRVEDDGPGLPADGSETEPSGHGLDHVTSRLEAVYGDDWELELSDRPQGGVVVEIVLPAGLLEVAVGARGKASAPLGTATADASLDSPPAAPLHEAEAR